MIVSKRPEIFVGMIDMELENRIKKLEHLVECLCVGTQAWNDEGDLMVIRKANSVIHYHAKKAIMSAVTKHEYEELKSKLEMMEQDYPELKQ